MPVQVYTEIALPLPYVDCTKKHKILHYDFGQDVKVTETYGRMTVHCGSYCERDERLQIIRDSKVDACM